MPSFVIEDYMLDRHSCQICCLLEIIIIIIIFIIALRHFGYDFLLNGLRESVEK